MNTPALKVLHIVGGNLDGGAARGAIYLSDALRVIGVNSIVICSDPHLNHPTENALSVASDLSGQIKSIIRSKAESMPMRLFPRRDGRLFSLGLTGIDWLNCDEYRECDIVHLHWINRGMVSVKGLSKIRKPVVWTLRDMWPFTGGCHYSMSCNGYREHCGQCPALGSHHDHDISSWILGRKKTYFPSGITYVGISEWISQCARRSALLANGDVRTISNSINTSVFRPMQQQEARSLLGLPMNRPILVHGALQIGDVYKGLAKLEEAKRLLDNKEILTCTFGAQPKTGQITADRHFGLIKDDEHLRAIYAAADVLAFPSIQESFGKVPAEAMACGTPCVVFDGSGPSEIVDHKVTGYVAEALHARDFAAGISWMLEDRERLRVMSEAAANDATRRFDPLVAAEEYLKIYHEKSNYLG